LLTRYFNFRFHYIDDDFLMSTSKCSDYADPIYLTQFEIKDATDIAWSSSSIDLHLEITLEDRYFTMRDDINFPIVNFKFLYNHIPAPHAYVVYMSQLIGYSSACELWKISID